MADNNSIVPFGDRSLKITTTTGESFDYAGNKASILPRKVGGGKPISSLLAGQPKDRLYEAGVNQIYLLEYEVGTNDQGKQEIVSIPVGVVGKTCTVRIVGMTQNRERRIYNGADERTEITCRSENLVTPDARYDGKFSHCCSQFDPRLGHLVTEVYDPAQKRKIPFCQESQFGEINPKTKKQFAPNCGLVCVFCAVIEFEDNHHLVEFKLKSKQTQQGINLAQMLLALNEKGLPFYAYPVTVNLIDAGVGNALTAIMQVPGRGQPEDTGFPQDDEVEILEAGVARWEEALKFRDERASRPAFDEAGADATSAADAAFGPAAGAPATAGKAGVVTTPPSAAKASGKKPLI